MIASRIFGVSRSTASFLYTHHVCLAMCKIVVNCIGIIEYKLCVNSHVIEYFLCNMKTNGEEKLAKLRLYKMQTGSQIVPYLPTACNNTSNNNNNIVDIPTSSPLPDIFFVVLSYIL